MTMSRVAIVSAAFACAVVAENAGFTPTPTVLALKFTKGRVGVQTSSSGSTTTETIAAPAPSNHIVLRLTKHPKSAISRLVFSAESMTKKASQAEMDEVAASRDRVQKRVERARSSNLEEIGVKTHPHAAPKTGDLLPLLWRRTAEADLARAKLRNSSEKDSGKRVLRRAYSFSHSESPSGRPNQLRRSHSFQRPSNVKSAASTEPQLPPPARFIPDNKERAITYLRKMSKNMDTARAQAMAKISNAIQQKASRVKDSLPMSLEDAKQYWTKNFIFQDITSYWGHSFLGKDVLSWLSKNPKAAITIKKEVDMFYSMNPHLLEESASLGSSNWESHDKRQEMRAKFIRSRVESYIRDRRSGRKLRYYSSVEKKYIDIDIKSPESLDEKILPKEVTDKH